MAMAMLALVPDCVIEHRDPLPIIAHLSPDALFAEHQDLCRSIVFWVINRYHFNHDHWHAREDFVQVGLWAAFQALLSYHEGLGVTLAYHVSKRARWAIQDALHHHVMRHQKREAGYLYTAQDDDEDSQGRETSWMATEDASIWRECGITPHCLVEALRTLKAEQPRKWELVYLHYWQEVPLEQVGPKLSVSRSRAQILHHEALVRLGILLGARDAPPVITDKGQLWAEVHRLLAEGCTQQRIAEAVGITVSGVATYIRLTEAPQQEECCKRGHPFTPANVIVKGGGARGCRQCNRENALHQQAVRRGEAKRTTPAKGPKRIRKVP